MRYNIVPIVSLSRIFLVIFLLCIPTLVPFPSFFFSSSVVIPIQRPSTSLIYAMETTTITKLVQEALLQHKEGNYGIALKLYKSVLPHLSGSVGSTINSNIGAIYLNIIGDNQEALKYFEDAVACNPTSSSAQYNLAVLLTSKLHLHGRAIKHAKLALSADPTHHKAMHLLGNILQDLGKEAEAQKYFLAAEELALAAGGAASVANLSQSSGIPAQRSDSQNSSPSSPLVNIDILKLQEGETRTIRWNLSQCDSGSEFDTGATVENINREIEINVRCLSREPRIIELENFITIEEAALIRERTGPLLMESRVMGESTHTSAASSTDSGATSSCAVEPEDCLSAKPLDSKSRDEPYRISSNAWLAPGVVSPLLSYIQLRLAAVTGIPIPYIRQMSEQLQVVRYPTGGYFHSHQDSSNFHKRLLTALIYIGNDDLSSGSDDRLEDDDYLSGGTWFPFASKRVAPDGDTGDRVILHSVESAIQTANDIAKARESAKSTPSKSNPLPGLVVQPFIGKAVLFFNHVPETGVIDPLAVHAGLPVGGLNKTKWVANYWVGLDEQLLIEAISRSS